MPDRHPFFSILLVRGEGEERVELADAVERFQYVDRERAADKLTLTVINEDLSHFDEPVWKKGTLLDVTWGYPGDAAPTRRVVVRSVVGARTLTIEAHGLEMLMATRRRTRTFERKTRSEVVAEIARENGFQRLDIQETTERFDTIVQSRRTDFEFVRRLANLEGFQVYADFDGFHWHERRLGARPTRVYTWGGPDSVVEDFDVENDVTARPGRVRVRGRNPLTGESFEVEEGADLSRSASSHDEGVSLAPLLEVIDPDTLESRLLTPAEVAAESASPEARTASVEERSTSASTPEAARREARARARDAALAAVKLRLELEGDPGCLAKSVVELRGFGRRLSVRYYVKEVEHTIDDGGYATTAKLVSDGHGGHSTESERISGLSAFGVGPRSRGAPNAAAPAPGSEISRGAATSTGESADAELEEFTRVDPDTGEEILSWGRGR